MNLPEQNRQNPQKLNTSPRQDPLPKPNPTPSVNPPKNVVPEDIYSELKAFFTERRQSNQSQQSPLESGKPHRRNRNRNRNRNTQKDLSTGIPSNNVPTQSVFHQTPSVQTGGTISQRPQKSHRSSYSQNQKSRGMERANEQDRRTPSLSLEPRDAQHFIMKPSNGAQKNFPYLTPAQSFFKHKPHPKEMHKKKTEKDTLRIIPFGGMEQVGINCIAFEYNNEIIIVDMGIQFPDEHMHGVAGRIPDISYLKGKKVLAVLITHGHIDHIGGIPYLMRILGTKVPVYAAPMALELIKMRQLDYKMPLNLIEFQRGKIVTLGQNFYAEPFTVDHSIPDSMGIRIHTPIGKFIHTGDWKFDSDPREGKPAADHEQLKKFGQEGVRALLSDSTNAHLPGSALAESIVIEPLEAIFEKSKGRIITGTFSSIIDRLQIIIETAEKFNRKVVLLGRGMLMYFEIAKKLGYIKNKPGTLITMQEADALPDNKVCICCTGAQGERYAALMRIATGESMDTEFRAGDSVIFSSSVIPGNERKVQELMDILHEQGVLIHHYRQSSIHAGGHAREEDVKLMIQETKPEVFIPIYGSRFMIHSNADIARGLGYKDDKIFVAHNGQIMEFTKYGSKITTIFAPHRIVTIDGYLIGFSGEKEFIERFQMQKSGVLIVNVNERDGLRVHLISHGFVNLALIPDIQEEIKNIARDAYEQRRKDNENRDDCNRALRKKVQSYIWMKLGKEPVVIIAS